MTASILKQDPHQKMLTFLKVKLKTLFITTKQTCLFSVLFSLFTVYWSLDVNVDRLSSFSVV